MGNIGPDIPGWLLGLILAPIWAMPSLLTGFVTGLVVRRVGYGVLIGTGFGVFGHSGCNWCSYCSPVRPPPGGFHSNTDVDSVGDHLRHGGDGDPTRYTGPTP